MATDVTDQSFEAEVLEASDHQPVIIDLWAPWCGPCRTLGPILEQVVEETEGKIKLAKVNVDENPQVSAAFQVQSIPAVFALKDRQVVDGFIGALPEQAVRQFVERISPVQSEADRLAEKGDEASLRRALELEPDHKGAIVALAELLVENGENDEALELLARLPQDAQTRRIAALARLGKSDGAPTELDDTALEERLTGLLDSVKHDDAARQEYLDVLESLDPSDPRRERFRRELSARLF